MKKLMTVWISVVLIIVSLIYSPIEYRISVAGKGNGKNAEISDLSEFGKLLCSVYDQSLKKNDLSNRGVTLLSYGGAEQDVSDIHKHTSYTFNNISTSSVEYVIEGDLYTTRISRDYKLYITEEAAYYKSKGTIFQFSKSVTSYIDFDTEVYIDETVCMIKLNKFDIAGGSEAGGDNKLFGIPHNEIAELYCIWLIASNDVYGRLSNMTSINMSQLKSIGEYIISNKPSDYVQNGGVFSLDGEALLRELLSIPGNISPKFYFSVDLRNVQCPRMELSCSAASDSYKYGYRVNSSDNMSFENIDNTVIKKPTKNVKDFKEIINKYTGESGE